MNRCFSPACGCRGEMTERFCRESLQECLDRLHLPGAGIPQREPCLPVQDCCGQVLHRHWQLCSARSAPTRLLTLWAPMTPSWHRPHSSQQPGPCGEGVPLSAGFLVSESLLEQMSAVLRALQPSLLCSCSGRTCGTWPCCGAPGAGQGGRY